MSTLKVAQLVKSFPGRPPVVALRGVDLDVPSGSLTAVLGPSGCGKTTLLRLIAGFDRPDAGTISIDGREMSSRARVVPPERRRVGIVPQEGALFPHLDVGRNIAFGLSRMPRADVQRRVDELLDLVGLAGFAKRRPDELSGGQQHRVALARALAPQPDVILLDEPFAALDTGLRAAIRADVGETLRRSGTTALLVTHDQAEAMTMADSVAVMRGGLVVQHESPAAVYRRPRDLDIARSTGDIVTMSGSVEGSVALCAFGRCSVIVPGDDAVSGPARLAFRPEQIRLHDEPGDGTVCATVLTDRFHGPDRVLGLQVGAELFSARWPGVVEVAPGDRVAISLDGSVLAYPVP